MSKKDCVNVVREVTSQVLEAKVTATQAAEIYDSLVAELISALDGGTDVALSKVGKFHTKLVPEHTARNPRTGESITVPNKRKLMFKPFKSFVDSTTTV